MDANEKGLQDTIARLRALEDARNGPGAYDHMVRKGMIILSGRRPEHLTESEKALFEAPFPSQRN